MREAIRRPGLPGTACWTHQSSSVLLSQICCPDLARSCTAWPDLGLARSWPPPKSSPAGSNIPPGQPPQRSWSVLFSHLFCDLVFYRFFLRFGLHLGSQNRLKTGKNRKKWVFKASSVFGSLFYRFFSRFLLALGQANIDFVLEKPIRNRYFDKTCCLLLGPLLAPFWPPKTYPKPIQNRSRA